MKLWQNLNLYKLNKMLNVERSLQITETIGFKEKYFAIKGLVRI